MSDFEVKLKELKAKAPATDIDDGTLRHMLEQADGNVEQALKEIRALTGEGEGYIVEAEPNANKVDALSAGRAGSTTPTPAIQTSPAPTTNTIDQPPADPQVAELHAMFPTVEVPVIRAVLETHADRTTEERFEKALEDLLQLTDPDYKPSPTASTGRTQPPHTHLDEEFARSLQIAEERQAQVQARAQRETGSSLTGDGRSQQLPYQPRAPRYNRPQGARQPSDDDDLYADGHNSTTGYDSYGRPLPEQTQTHNQNQDYNYRGGAGRFGGLWNDDRQAQPGAEGPGIEEKIGKYAEVGKQKLDMFLNTARSKVNEFDQLQQQRQATGQQQAGISNTLNGIFNDARAVATGRRDGQSPPATGGGNSITAAFPGLSGLSGLFGSRAPAARANESPSNNFSSTSGSTTGGYRSGATPRSNSHNAAPTAGRRWQPTDIFDDLEDPQERTIKVYQPGSSASSTSSAPSASDDFLQDNTPKQDSHLNNRFPGTFAGPSAGSSASAVETGKPAAQKIDLAKIGMLPKKQVSLLGTSPSNTTESAHKQIPAPSGAKRDGKDDLDDEEFTKNPFEE